jgi:hypothetical protein
MAAGSIVIDLLMKTGAFVTDSKRAEKQLNELKKTAALAGKAIGASLGAGVVAAAIAFDQLVKGAGDFQDVAEQIGDSAENVASLTVALGQAGVGMDAFASASAKLSKGLVGVDDESKAVGAALKAIGIEIEAFKRLAPVDQYEAVGKALAGYADGAEKTAIAQALFGKAGTEQLRVFKALEEQGGRQVVLTQRQIDLADAYADSISRSTATLKLYAQSAAIDLLPTLNDVVATAIDFIKAINGIDESTGKLANDGALVKFADGAARAFAFVIDQGDSLKRGIEVSTTSLVAFGTALERIQKADFAGAREALTQLGKDVDAILGREMFGEKLDKRIQARMALAGSAGDYSNEGRRPTQPRIVYDGAEKKAQKEKQTDAERYLETLRQQLQGVQELTTFEKLNADIAAGKFKGATDASIVEARNLAVQIDAQRALTEARKADNDALTETNKRVQENFERARDLTDSVATPAERLRNALQAINDEADRNPFLKQETQARLASEAWAKYNEEISKANVATNTFAQQAADSIQGSLSGSIQSVIEGDFKNLEQQWKSLIVRLAAEAAAAELGKRLLGGDYGKTGQVGGWLGQLVGLFGGGTSGPQLDMSNTGGMFADGGRPPIGRMSLVGERGPELFVPSTQGTIVPNEALGGGGDSIEIINPPGMPLQGQTRESKQSNGRRTKQIVLSIIADDAAEGGAGIKSIGGALGARRTLPRRGR